MTHSRNITLLSLVNSGWMLVALTVIVLASCDAKVPPTFRTSVQVSPNGAPLPRVKKNLSVHVFCVGGHGVCEPFDRY